MVSPELIESVNASREYAERPETYSGFSLTADRKMIGGCIEPKDPDDVAHGDYKVIIQSGGGAPGEGLDNALTLAVVEKRFVTIEEGMARDRDERKLIVLGGHHRCKFIAGLLVVVEEIAEPTVPTINNFERWARYLNHEEVLSPSFRTPIKDAAKRKLEHLQGQERMDHLIAYTDALYPNHANVGHVRGDGQTFVWVTNLHPNVGQDRNTKPSDPNEAMQVRAYHDSLAASVVEIEKMDLPRRERTLRLSALLARAAAVRTVITREQLADTVFYEARPGDTKHGIKIVQEDLSLA
jgi:hypothetical protein